VLDPVLQVLGLGCEREAGSCQHEEQANSSRRQRWRRGPTRLVVPIRATANASRERVIEPARMTVPGMSSESCWMRVERYRVGEALPHPPTQHCEPLYPPVPMTARTRQPCGQGISSPMR
jgi:hypothetical protein